MNEGGGKEGGGAGNKTGGFPRLWGWAGASAWESGLWRSPAGPGFSLAGVAGPGRQTPGLPSLPCCLARAHRPLPADLSSRTLYFSSVDLVPGAVCAQGCGGGPGRCLATAPTPPLSGMDLSGLLGFVHSCPFREDTTPCSISVGPACSDSLHHRHH